MARADLCPLTTHALLPQDFLTCAYLMSNKDKFLTRAEFCLLAACMSDGLEHIDVPSPAIIKPMELWTGKQLFSSMVRPNANTKIFVNLEMPEKIYSKKGEHMCPLDGYVAFRNSELMCGRLGKGVLGGSKGGLFGTLNSDFSPMAAAACMSRLAKLSARQMGNHGFRIGIGDVSPRATLVKSKGEMMDKGYGQCLSYIDLYNKGKLQLQPGCNLDQTLESQVRGENS